LYGLDIGSSQFTVAVIYTTMELILPLKTILHLILIADNLASGFIGFGKHEIQSTGNIISTEKNVQYEGYRFKG